MRHWGRTVFGNIGEILKAGHSRIRQTFNFSDPSDQYSEDFQIERIFKYFPYWQTRFEISGRTYGGDTDYSSERISLLNLANLIQFVDLKNLSLLELGPLEGGNTLKLCRMGARKITAIEGRVENYLKCCTVKNLFGLDQAKFVLDDVRNISREKYGFFDAALVAGILYHLDNPSMLLQRLSQMTDVLLVATHYADEASPYPKSKVMVLETIYGTYRGKVYREGLQTNINSGLQGASFWPFEEDLFQMCRDAGYRNITVLAKNPIHTEQFKLLYFLAKKG